MISSRTPWRIVVAVLGVLVLVAVAFVVLREPVRRLAAGPAATPGARETPGAAATGEPTGAGDPAAPVGPSGVPMPRGDLPGWRQVFTDDFAGSRLDGRWLAYDGQPQGDPGGWFDPSHVSVSGGLLTIGAWRDPARRNLYVTGGVSNRNVLSQTYGRYDVRFRMDQGRGIAYALLLWPASNRYPPEIDFAEDNGRDRRMLYGSVHPADGSPSTGREVAGDFTQWHTAGVQWVPGAVTYMLDGRVWATVTGAAVPAEPMTLALQSQAWYCGHGWEACPDATTPDRVNLQMDWVVAYARAD